MTIDEVLIAYRIFLGRWVSWVVRRAQLVVFISLAFTIATTFYLIENAAINTSTADMLSRDLSFRQNSERIDAAFPQTDSTLVVVIDGQNADIADDAALMLAAEMRRMPSLYRDVYDIKGTPFFRQNGFLYLDLDEIHELSDRLAVSQPFLGTLWRDPTLRGLFEMLAVAINHNLRFPNDQTFKLEDVLNDISKVMEHQLTGQFHRLSWTRLISQDDLSLTNKRRFIIVQPVKNYAQLQPAKIAINQIRKMAQDLDLTPEHGVRVRMTGSVALEDEELESVEEGMGLAAVVSFTLVFGLLLVGLRHWVLVAVCLVTLIVGLIWTAGFAIWAIGTLNILSVAFAVLFIGLSVDFGIHFVLRYREELWHGYQRREALVEATYGLGGTLTLCAVSAAIAFYAFLPTDYVGLAELGLIAGTGMFIAFFANFTLLPALIVLSPLTRSISELKARPTFISFSQWNWIIPAARWICLAALILGVFAAAMIPKVGFDFDPLNLKDPSTESVETLRDIITEGNRSQHIIEILASDLQTADFLASRLRSLDVVDRVSTLSDFVPEGQDEKLAAIQDLAMMIGPALSNVRKQQPLTNSERLAAWHWISTRLRAVAKTQSGSLKGAANRFLTAGAKLLKAQPDGKSLFDLEKRLLAGLPGRLNALSQSLNAERITLENLPDALRDRQVAADGRALVKVMPRSDLTDRHALRAFVQAVRTVSPDAVGSPVVISEAGRVVLSAFFQAFLIAVFGILILLWFVLRNIREVLLVFSPLVLAGLFTVAVATMLGQVFNLANVIVLPLLFGLGVAGGIHIVDRTRDASHVLETLRTSTPRAVFFSALTTIGSFGSISLSGHPGTSSMGILLTLALFMTLLSTLVFLPALLALMPGVALKERT